MGNGEGRKDDEGKLDWTLLHQCGAQLIGNAELFESMLQTALMNRRYGHAVSLIMFRSSVSRIEAMEEVVRVLSFGAQKYERDGWARVEDPVRRYRAACMRHVVAMRDNFFDSESGLPHYAHALCSLVFLYCLDGVQGQ